MSLSSRRKNGMPFDEFEFDLPEEIIHRIQYFLGGSSNLVSVNNLIPYGVLKEVARTCTLSKSWYSAWCTRPDLVIAHQFQYREQRNFPTFARKTIQRYKDSNMPIRSLVLVSEDYNGKDGAMLADEVIAGSLNLGLNELRVHIHTHTYGSYIYTLPAQVLETTTLTKLFVSKCKIVTGRVLCSGLVSLTLVTVEIDDIFLNQLLSLIPCIENLTLHQSPGYEDIQISSKSLKYLELRQGTKFKKARFEVPNIEKLIFDVWCIPSLSFCTESKEWESHVNWFTYRGTSEVPELRKFLTELSGSKIYLRIIFIKGDIVFQRDLPCLPTPPVVENLKLILEKSSCVKNTACLLGGLFQCCRPRFITLDDCYTKTDTYKMLKLISGTISFLNNKDKYNSNQENKPMDLNNPVQSLCLMYGLEKVNMEHFDENLKEWRTIPLGNPLDTSSDRYIKGQIRCHFIWRGV